MRSFLAVGFQRIKEVLNKCLTPRGLACLSVAGAAVIVLGEHDLTSIPFVLAVFCALWMALSTLSKRIKFSLIATWVLIVIITTVSTMKLRYMGMSLHVFDIYFYQRDGEIFRFLLESYLLPLSLSLAIFAVGIIVSVIVYRRDVAIKTSRAVLAILFGASIVLAVVTNPLSAEGQSGKAQSYNLDGHRTSSFFVSLSDARFLVGNPPFVERLTSQTNQAGYQGLDNCSQAKARPDIIAVLMESAFPPSVYPAIKAPSALNDRFRSADGVIRPLQIETFGGGTWITTASLMTSLPAVEFGWLRPYLPVYLKNRVHHSLPELLAKCGYKTAVISPLPYPFVNEGPFLTSLGFQDYRDSKLISSPSKHERDDFYFRAATDYIRQHQEKDGRPLFLFVMTMAAHGPFSYRFKPEITVPGEPFGNDAETDEYLRRLTMQQMDFDAFNREATALNGKRGLIVLDFGDHQPSVTLNFAQAADGESALARWDSSAYRTYYRIRAMNTPLKTTLPQHPSMDMVYLAPTLMQAAGLPIDDVYSELLKLREDCNGAFLLCADHARVEQHLKRLAKGRLLELDTGAAPASAPVAGAQSHDAKERQSSAAAFRN